MANVGNVGNESKDLYVKGGDGQDTKTKAKTPSKEINSAFTVKEPINLEEVKELEKLEILEWNKKDARELLGKIYDTLTNNKPIKQQNIGIVSYDGPEPAGSPFKGKNAKIQPDNLNEQAIEDHINKFNEPEVDEYGNIYIKEGIEEVTYKPGSFKKEGDVISFTVSYTKIGNDNSSSHTYRFDSVTGEKLPLDLPKDFDILRDNEGNITGYNVKGSFDAYQLGDNMSLPEGSIEYTETWNKDCQVTNRTMDFSKVKFEFLSMKGDIHKTGVIEYDFVKNQGVQPEENKPKKSLNMEW